MSNEAPSKIRRSLLLGSAGSVVLAACQGQTLESDSTGAVAESTGSPLATPSVQPTVSAAPAAAPTVAPPFVAPRNSLEVRLFGGGSQFQYPLQFGRPFLPGEIQGRPGVLLDGVAIASQADVKARHADGSVKFAVISLILPVLDGNTRVISFKDESAGGISQALSVASMLADFDFDAKIEVRSATGSLLRDPVSARAMLSALNDSQLQAETATNGVQSRYWTKGAICTSVILCDHVGKSYDLGTSAGRALRPLFHVQFWPGIGRYFVRHVLEMSDVTKLHDELGLEVTLYTGKAQPAARFKQSGVNLYAGTWLSRAFWNGTDLPVADVKHGLRHLSATGVIPNFDPMLMVSSGVVNSYADNFATKSQDFGAAGYWQKAMATTGGRQDLGLLPKWDVLSIYSGASVLQTIGEKQAEFAGCWAFYFREGDAGKLISGTSSGLGRIVSKLGRPTVFLYDNNNYMGWSATAAADKFVVEGRLSPTRDGWLNDSAHTPGLFWWQYLSTGQAFWHEKLLQLGAWSQFVTNPAKAFNHLSNGRSPSDLVINGTQVRGLGWQYRNRARAWWAALEGSPEKALFERAMDDATAMLEGLHDLPGDFADNPIRQAWNANYLSFYNGYVSPAQTLASPRPNALGYFGVKGAATDAQMFSALGFHLPDDTGGGAVSPWMQTYTALCAWHAVELGYSSARELAKFATRLAISMANSSAPRHLGDYYFPDSKNDGGFYQSLEDVYDGWAHKADGTLPTYMPSDPGKGFPGVGTKNTWNVAVEGYASSAVASIAMAKSAPGQAQAWTVVMPWYSGTRMYSDDPRYAIVPRD